MGVYDGDEIAGGIDMDAGLTRGRSWGENVNPNKRRRLSSPVPTPSISAPARASFDPHFGIRHVHQPVSRLPQLPNKLVENLKKTHIRIDEPKPRRKSRRSMVHHPFTPTGGVVMIGGFVNSGYINKSKVKATKLGIG